MGDDLLQAADSFRLGTEPSDEEVDRANFLIDRLTARLSTAMVWRDRWEQEEARAIEAEAKLAKAVEKERERCADVALNARLGLSGCLDTVKDVRALIAAAIRRGDD